MPRSCCGCVGPLFPLFLFIHCITVLGHAHERPRPGLESLRQGALDLAGRFCMALRGGGTAGRMVRLEALHKHLQPDELLAVVGSIDELGHWNVHGAREMKLYKRGVWTAELKLHENQEVQYKYVVLSKPQYESDIDGNRVLSIPNNTPEYFTVVDVMGDNVRSLAGVDAGVSALNLGNVRFEVIVDDDRDVSQICVVGAHTALGTWKEGDGVEMKREEGSNVWVGTAELPLGQRVEFKFVVWRTAKKDLCGESRHSAVYADVC